MTEAELRDQMMARLGAEKQLQAAEKALEHLENALRLTGAQMTELQEHIMPDVRKLRGKVTGVEGASLSTELTVLCAYEALCFENSSRSALRRPETKPIAQPL